ncbi:hypothetical protein KAR91_16635 [Candidatus Pacearchaeota archaeon]|nr:hypothetical protein [Candidatus Pacearchaeota archaeon]
MKLLPSGKWPARKCDICGQFHSRNHQAKYCIKCSGARDKVKGKAHAAVNKATLNGLLRPLRGMTECVDCGKPATCYDHRDYDKPLDVDPVCHSCDKRRGIGLNSFKWGLRG